jgi:serine/threonine protein kinase
MAIAVGDLISGRYKVDAFIGKGGMADVYRVYDQGRAATLAMKVLKPDLAEDRVFIRRFQREAQTLITLQHPNIVRFYEFEDHDGLVFMLMDFIDGTTLRKEIFRSQDQSLSFDRILQIASPICSALNYAHEMGVIHCDIKPANIMIASNGKVLLSDFGISHLTDSATSTMAGVGTPAYMAPEQIKGQETSAATDIYAMGTVLYEMLTAGERPFTGERAGVDGSTGEKVLWEKLNSSPDAPSIFNPAIPPSVDEVVLRCLEIDPINRFESTRELLSALEDALKGKSPEGNVSSRKTSASKKTDRKPKQAMNVSEEIDPTVLEKPDGARRPSSAAKKKVYIEPEPEMALTPSRQSDSNTSFKPEGLEQSALPRMDKPYDPPVRSNIIPEHQAGVETGSDPLRARNARNLKIFGGAMGVLIAVIAITSVASISFANHQASIQLTNVAETQAINIAGTETAVKEEKSQLAQTITAQAIKALATATPEPTQKPSNTPRPTATSVKLKPTATPGRVGCIDWNEVASTDIGHTICVKGAIWKRYSVNPFYYIGFINDNKSHFVIRKVMTHCDKDKCYLLLNEDQTLGAGTNFMPFTKGQCIAFTGEIHFDNNYYFMGDSTNDSCGEEGRFSSSCKIVFSETESCE